LLDASALYEPVTSAHLDSIAAIQPLSVYIFQDKKVFDKKEAREGFKQADQVLNLKFVDENEGQGGGKGGKGGKGDRRQGGKGDRRQGGKGGFQAPRESSGAKANIDLSNEGAFPTLGA
jgi:hypothetical protein